MIELDIAVADEGWRLLADLDAVAANAADAALAVLPDAPAGPLAASLLFTDDLSVRALNARWRNQDKPTNVLSFPAAPHPGSPRELGDVVLARETVAREAAEAGRSFRDHTAHLVVHGLLHCFGLDHEVPGEADAMEALEVAALARLGIADPYREPA